MEGLDNARDASVELCKRVVRDTPGTAGDGFLIKTRLGLAAIYAILDVADAIRSLKSAR